MTLLPDLKNIFNNKKAAPISNLFFEAAFQYSQIGFIVYSKETLEVIETNQKISILFELPDDKKLKGLYISQVMMRYLSGDSPNLELLMNDIHKDWKGEALFVSHMKNKFYGLVNTNILSGRGDMEFRILSILDISIFKESQEMVRSANEKFEMASRSKDRFLSSMSHELRTPLNGIVGATDLILTEPGISPEIKEHLSVIKYSSQHMLGIINDILDFSKIDAHKMKLNERPFRLLTCLNNIMSSFKIQFEEHKIGLKSKFEGEKINELIIIGDEIKLSQVLKNLLSNALKFTNEGDVYFRVIVREVSEHSATLLFGVKDSGIGIPKNKQKEIFQAFEQVYNEDLKRKYQGSGLGLTISSRLVKMMGGNLEVESELGYGSDFFFTVVFNLPENNVDTPETIEAQVPPAQVDVRGIRALVVEDNEINAGILRSFLNRWKMPVKEAITGVHALELLKYHKFDVILMDLEMPEMNGYTALKKIREQGLDVPVIAFTATLMDDMNSLITDAGFTDYITKPFKPGELKSKIAKYCERKIDYV